MVLDQSNNIGLLSVNNANQVLINDLSGISVGVIDTLSSFDLSTTGLLTQTDGWSVGGDLSLTLIGNTGVNLSASGNVINGLISIDTFVANGQFTDVTINNDTAINLDSINVSNNLTLNSNGQITVNNPVLVDGVIAVDTDGDNSGNIFNVIIDSDTNQINQLAANNTNDLTVSASDSIILNTLDVSGDLLLTVENDISSTNIVTVGGNTVLTTINGGDIALSNSANMFTGDFSISSTTGQFGSINLTSGDVLNISDANWTAANEINISSDMLISNDLILESINGNVVYAGDINGSNSLTVNALQGIANFASSNIGQNIALDTVTMIATDILVGNINAVNNISLTSLSGGTSFDSLTSSGNVVLNSSAEVVSNSVNALEISTSDLQINSVNGVYGSSGPMLIDVDSLSINNVDNGNISLSEAGSLRVDQLSNQNGSISLTSVGSITQAGDISVSQGGANDIYLRSDDAITMIEPALTSNAFGDIDYHAENDIIVSQVSAPNGRVTLTSDSGNVYTTNVPPSLANPDITGSEIQVNTENGSFGQGQFYFVLSSPGGDVLINSVFNVRPVFTQPPPTNVDIFGTTINPVDAASLLGGDQRTQFSELSTIDPTIFTEVRNFEEEETAILLPEDQRYSSDI